MRVLSVKNEDSEEEKKNNENPKEYNFFFVRLKLIH